MTDGGCGVRLVITKAQLEKMFPSARPDLVAAVVRGWPKAEAAGIDNNRRKVLFLANIGVETGGLKTIDESMVYTTHERLMKVWPTRFKSVEAARPFVRNPIELAIKVYGGRMGNAAAPSQDGWLYRGGGMIQTTGRKQYRIHGFEKNPEVLRTNPDVAFETAVKEWVQYKLNPVADAYNTRRVRRVINGGYNGWEQAEMYRKRAEKIWPLDEVDESQPADEEASDPIADSEVAEVQQKLKDLGYTEVGLVDGEVGRYTRAAISAFKNDVGLSGPPVIDAALKKALESAPERAGEDKRMNVPVKEIRSIVPEVAKLFWTKAVSLFWAIIGVITSIGYGISQAFSEAQEKLDPIKAHFEDIPGWVWLALLTIVSGWVWLIANSGEQDAVKAYRKGKRRGN